MKIYSNVKSIYGPYQSSKDHRFRVVLIYNNGSRKTISYPKFKMEQHLNKYLKKDETVDHKDQDVTHNEIKNFKIIQRALHAKLDAKRNKPQEFTCPQCNNKFILSGKKLNYAIVNRKRGRAGPFCNKHCSGLYSSSIQNKQINKLKVTTIIPNKYSYHNIE